MEKKIVKLQGELGARYKTIQQFLRYHQEAKKNITKKKQSKNKKKRNRKKLNKKRKENVCHFQATFLTKNLKKIATV